MKRSGRRHKENNLQSNEFSELQLLAESGGELIRVGELSEETAQAVSQQIRVFQQKHETAISKTLYELIGRPRLKPAETLSEEKMAIVVESLILKLARKKIHFEVVSSIAIEKLYRFFLENLDRIHVPDLRLKGWNTHLFYEDFQPEPENSLKLSAYNLFASLFSQNLHIPLHLFSSTVLLNGKLMDQTKLIKHLEQWKTCLIDGRFLNMNVRYSEFSEDRKCVVSEIAFDYRKYHKGRRTSINCSAGLEFEDSSDAPLISAIDLPLLSEEFYPGRPQKKRG